MLSIVISNILSKDVSTEVTDNRGGHFVQNYDKHHHVGGVAEYIRSGQFHIERIPDTLNFL